MLRKSFFAVLFSAVVVFAGAVFAGSQAGDEAFSRLMDGNMRFVSGSLGQKDIGTARRNELVGGQHPFAIVVTCSDSRVAPEYIFDQGLGDIFVIRVAGNVLDPVALGSVEYAAEHLGSHLLVLMGHEKCGAVKAAVEATGEPEGNIGAILKKIMPAVNKAKGGTQDEIINNAIRENVAVSHRSVLEKSPLLKHLIEKGELKVVDAVYHLASGEVEILATSAAPAPAPHAKTH